MGTRRQGRIDIPTAPLPGPLLTLDVSSTAAGYAIFAPSGEPTAFGVIRPRAAAVAIARIDEIVRRLTLLLDEHRTAAVLMEFSSGKVHGRLGRTPGLSVLGAAQGAVRQLCLGLGYPVATVEENEWTAGVPKAKRAAKLALLVAGYAAVHRDGEDPGLDMADALGIGFHYFALAREAELLARASAREASPCTTPTRPAPTARRRPGGRARSS